MNAEQTGEHVDGRRLRYQHRRPELLGVVAEHVLAHGVADLSMRPLAAALGVSHGTLLHHFGSKENLVTEVMKLLRERMMDAADVAGSPQRVDSLRDWWRRSTSAERLPVYRLLFEVYALAVRQPERYQGYLRQLVHESRQLMESLVRADGCPPDQAPAVASMIVAQARGLHLDLIVTGDHDRVDRSFALFVDLVAGLRHAWRSGGPERQA